MPINITIRRDKEPIVKFEAEYEIGSIVYLISDPEQYKRVVIKYYVDYTALLYEVSCGADEPTLHYAFELNDKKNVI